LLDWTRNPLVALYFSVCKEFECRDGLPLREDAQILAWRTGKKNLGKQPPEFDPLKFMGEEVERYIPRVVTPRLRAQSGVFTWHRYPWKEFKIEEGLTRIRVPRVNRKKLEHSLFQLGIHEAALFPDLDGLARHIEWLQTKSH
jgi:hypothetical protein